MPGWPGWPDRVGGGPDSWRVGMATTHPEKTVFDHDIADHVEETNKTLSQRPVLIMLDGSEVNRRYRIDKPEITIGRDILSDIVLHDTRCSRHHASLIYKNYEQSGNAPEIVLSDQKST